MRGSLVALGIVLVAAAAAVAVPLAMDRTVAGTPVAVRRADDPLTPSTTAEVQPECDGAAELVASGSSLADDAVTKLIAAYQAACPSSTAVYNPVGTGAGIRDFGTGATAMAVTDRPLRADELTGARCEVQQVPFVARPDTLPYRLSGVDDLTLDAPTIAKIFSGAVTAWNDPAIAALNPGTQLPALPITVVSRADESDETAAFQQYLAAVGGWTGGTDTTFTGTTSSTAVQGGNGVLQVVTATDGAIGYVAAREGTTSQLVRIGGVAPDLDAVAATIETALPADGLALETGNLYKADPADGAYPPVIVNYAVACTGDAAVRDLLLSSLTVRDGETTLVFPTGEWAKRVVEELR